MRCSASSAVKRRNAGCGSHEPVEESGLPSPHPKYQDLPPLSDQDYARLKASVEKHGILVPVIDDENGDTLDGHHRVKAWLELGRPIEAVPVDVRAGLTEDEK